MIYSVGNSYPVRDDLQAPFSWAITKALSAGAYDPLRSAAQAANLPAIDDACKATTSATTQRKGQLPLNLTGGPLLISVIACTIAMLLFVFGEGRRARRKLAENDLHKIIKVPSFAERTYKMKARAEQLLATAERSNPAYGNQDLRLIARMLKSRHMTQIRIDALSDIRTDCALTLNDVPMILKAVRDTIGDALEKDTPGQKSRGFSQYLRGSANVLDDDEEETEDLDPADTTKAKANTTTA